MLANAPTCPRCQSTKVVKNGRIHSGRQTKRETRNRYSSFS